MADHDVLTSQRLDSMVAFIKQSDKPLGELKGLAKQEKLEKTRASLLKRIEELRHARLADGHPAVGNLPVKAPSGGDPDKALHDLLAKTLSDMNGYVAEVKQTRAAKAAQDAKEAAEARKAAAEQFTITYYFGTTRLANADALKREVHSFTKRASLSNVSQAVEASVSGKGAKSASKIGSDVLHSSAGATGSRETCTIFYTRQTEGRNTIIKVIGVGEHVPDKSASYKILKSFDNRIDSKIKNGELDLS